MSGKCRDSPGISPGQSCEIFVYVFSCLLACFPFPKNPILRQLLTLRTFFGTLRHSTGSRRLSATLSRNLFCESVLHWLYINNKTRKWDTRSAIATILRSYLSSPVFLGECKPGGFPNPGVAHFFSGKGLIVSRALWGMFLVGAWLNRPRKRKGINRENLRRVGKIIFNPRRIGKVPKG